MTKTRKIGGMTKTKWAGKPMWKCPRCNSTTFKEAESKTHSCKEVRYEKDEATVPPE